MNEIIKADANEISVETAKKLAVFFKELKDAEEYQKKLKSQIIEIFNNNGLIKYEDENIDIKLVDGFDKESFDTKAFKEENPDIYDSYIKMTHTAPSLRIKTKI